MVPRGRRAGNVVDGVDASPIRSRHSADGAHRPAPLRLCASPRSRLPLGVRRALLGHRRRHALGDAGVGACLLERGGQEPNARQRRAAVRESLRVSKQSAFVGRHGRMPRPTRRTRPRRAQRLCRRVSWQALAVRRRATPANRRLQREGRRPKMRRSAQVYRRRHSHNPDTVESKASRRFDSAIQPSMRHAF